MKIKVEETGKRIDVYLIDKTELSRSQIQKAIKNNEVFVNGNIIKSNYNVKENDVIDFNYVEQTITVEPKKMDLNIVYEDDDVMVINKDNGVVVHPGNGNYEDTLVNGLMYYTDNLSESDFRPGIVHRIDAYTTGLIMIAKNTKAHEFLSNQLKDKTVTRRYIALVWGVINNDTGKEVVRKYTKVGNNGYEEISEVLVLPMKTKKGITFCFGALRGSSLLE